ncbi:hypothetical protein F4779DRAFT_172448 [Xylariaceae sp. FL0662B]|nr:hypothetical protein F4779DRAFT_172448 [Xylariaceae sp. FL0662B]
MADPDSDPEPHSSSCSPAPQTPPRKARAEHDHYDVATPKSTPPASPSFSLHSLGMSPFSPLRRRFPSPFARSSPSPHSDAEHSEQEENLAEDSKDVLVQRLNEVAVQLSQQHHLKEETINQLHRRMDDMEKALSIKDWLPKPKSKRPRPASLVLRRGRSERESFGEPSTPGPSRSDIANVPSSARNSSLTEASGEAHGTKGKGPTRGPGMSSALAKRVVVEARNLCKEMEHVITNLRARQEETEHIHELLITRAERAAQRIIYLERRVGELERERNEGEMEMLNLQIQLKAIEVQCLSYVPKDADEDLRESISAWKTEWSALKRKRARKDRGTPGTPTRPPRNIATPD